MTELRVENDALEGAQVTFSQRPRGTSPLDEKDVGQTASIGRIEPQIRTPVRSGGVLNRRGIRNLASLGGDNARREKTGHLTADSLIQNRPNAPTGSEHIIIEK